MCNKDSEAHTDMMRFHNAFMLFKRRVIKEDSNLVEAMRYWVEEHSGKKFIDDELSHRDLISSSQLEMWSTYREAFTMTRLWNEPEEE
jgi:hypothetical protein